MSRMTVHMFGLMYFELCKERNRVTVLLPDGRDGDGPHIPPHYASLFVESRACRAFTPAWRPRWHDVPNLTGRSRGPMAHVLEFRINTRCTLKFPADEVYPEVNAKSLERGLLDIHDADRAFDPDLDSDASIAKIEITSGLLEAFNFNRNANAVQWTIRPGTEELKIEAGTESLTLAPDPDSEFGAEVVLANIPDFLSSFRAENGMRPHHAPDNSVNHDHHFGLFRKIDKSRNRDKPLRLPQHRGGIRYGSNAMAFHDQLATIAGSCTPPCCKPIPGG